MLLKDSDSTVIDNVFVTLLNVSGAVSHQVRCTWWQWEWRVRAQASLQVALCKAAQGVLTRFVRGPDAAHAAVAARILRNVAAHAGNRAQIYQARAAAAGSPARSRSGADGVARRRLSWL